MKDTDLLKINMSRCRDKKQWVKLSNRTRTIWVVFDGKISEYSISKEWKNILIITGNASVYSGLKNVLVTTGDRVLSKQK